MLFLAGDQSRGVIVNTECFREQEGGAAAASTQELFCCVLLGYTMRTPEGTFFPVKEKDFR